MICLDNKVSFIIREIQFQGIILLTEDLNSPLLPCEEEIGASGIGVNPGIEIAQ